MQYFYYNCVNLTEALISTQLLKDSAFLCCQSVIFKNILSDNIDIF